jgi:hypothetical protein
VEVASASLCLGGGFGGGVMSFVGECCSTC